MARRLFVLSKSDEFLGNNAILNLKVFEIDTAARYTETRIKFKDPLTKPDEEFYSKLTARKIKDEVLRRYLPFFIDNVSEFPAIVIEEFVGGTSVEKLTIIANDIPTPNHSSDIHVQLSKFDNDGKSICKLSKESVFHVTALKRPKHELDQNGEIGRASCRERV